MRLYSYNGSASTGAMLCDVVVRTHPRAMPLAMMTMRKWIHGLGSIGMGLRMAAFGRRSSAIIAIFVIFDQSECANLCNNLCIILNWPFLFPSYLKLPDCGKVTNDEGEITTPYYHTQYPNKLDCEWIISVDAEQKDLRLKFTSFDLKESVNCSADYIVIRDGKEKNSTVDW